MHYAFCDCRIPSSALSSLEALGFLPVLLPPHRALRESAVASHTDIILFSLGDLSVVSKKYIEDNPKVYSYLNLAFGKSNVILSGAEAKEGYPAEAAFNALRIGSRLFFRPDDIAPEIPRLSEEKGLSLHHVRQGYPACVTLGVSDSAAITSDCGMARAMRSAGVDVLLIGDSQNIKLPPYGNGFLGGAAGSYKDDIFFVGDLSCHPEHNSIKDFIESHGKRAISLMPGEGSLYDVGGILFI